MSDFETTIYVLWHINFINLPIVTNTDYTLCSPGTVELNLNNMPKPAKKAGSCSLKMLPEAGKKQNIEMVSLFEQKRIKGFWPCYNDEKGARELTVRCFVRLFVNILLCTCNIQFLMRLSCWSCWCTISIHEKGIKNYICYAENYQSSTYSIRHIYSALGVILYTVMIVCE